MENDSGAPQPRPPSAGTPSGNHHQNHRISAREQHDRSNLPSEDTNTGSTNAANNNNNNNNNSNSAQFLPPLSQRNGTGSGDDEAYNHNNHSSGGNYNNMGNSSNRKFGGGHDDDGESAYSRQSGSPRRLIDAKRSRRQAELDAQAIRNRVERLRLEEEKATKKIEETRKRAHEILQLKARNEERQRQREEQRMLKEMQLRRAVQQKAVVKAARQAALKSSKIVMIKAKRQEVLQQKMSKQVYLETIEKSRDSDRVRARGLKEAIREREVGMLQRRYKHQQFAEFRAQTAYESRLDEEERERNRAAMAIRQLEDEEEELIQRLRLAYEKQRTAYVELERALDV